MTITRILLLFVCTLFSLGAAGCVTPQKAVPGGTPTPIPQKTPDITQPYPTKAAERTPAPPKASQASPTPTIAPPLSHTPKGSLGTPGTQFGVQEAREDLAQRLGIPSQDITVVSITSDEFPAGDLGCPAPGETPPPIPAFILGKTLILEAGDTHYVYHIAGGRIAFCGQR